jgi:hypothetical protein
MSMTDTTDFDPTTVPVYPVVPIELRQLDGEPSQRVYVNGREIPVPAGIEPKDAAMAAAAAEAATQMGDAIRVNATAPDGQTWRMVVHADGRVWDLPNEDAAKRRPAWLMPVIAAGATAVLAVGVAVAVTTTRAGDGSPSAATTSTPAATPSGTPTELPVLPPEGWSSHARWSSPALGDPDAPVLITDQRAVLATDSQLVAINTTTGTTAWRSSLPSGGLSAGPALTHLGDGPSIVAQSGDRLLWWPTEGAKEPRTIPLPNESKISTNGAAALATISETRAAVIDSNGAVEARVVPAGSVALAANVDGTITTASDSGLWWHVDNPRLAKDGTALRVPAKGAKPLKVAGYAGHHLVTVWTLPDTSLLAAVYDDAANMRLVTTARLGGRSDDPAWNASPTNNWGVIGNVMIDLASGKTRELGDWTTTKINNEAVYGDNGGATNKLAVDRTGQTHLLTADSTIPVALLPTGDALVIGDDGNGSRLYLVPPRTGS